MRGRGQRPAASFGARHRDVTDLVRGAIAIGHDRSRRGGADGHAGRGGLAAVADPRVDDLARADALAPEQRGAQRHGAAGGGLPAVEPEGAHSVAVTREGDEAVLGLGAVVVERTQRAPEAAAVGRARHQDRVGVLAGARLGQPVRVELAALALGDRREVGPVGEQIPRGDGDRRRPAAGLEARRAQGVTASGARGRRRDRLEPRDEHAVPGHGQVGRQGARRGARGELAPTGRLGAGRRAGGREQQRRGREPAPRGVTCFGNARRHATAWAAAGAAARRPWAPAPPPRAPPRPEPAPLRRRCGRRRRRWAGF